MDSMKFFAIGLIGMILTITYYIIYENLKEHYFYASFLTIFVYISILIAISYFIFKSFKKS